MYVRVSSCEFHFSYVHVRSHQIERCVSDSHHFLISLNKIKSIFLIVFRYTEMYNCTRCRLSTFKSFLIKNFQLRICYVIEKFWNFELFEISSFGPILGFEVERYKQHLKSFSLVQKVRLRNKYNVIVFWNYM